MALGTHLFNDFPHPDPKRRIGSVTLMLWHSKSPTEQYKDLCKVCSDYSFPPIDTYPDKLLDVPS
jgi:hypothetical protein